MGVGQRLVEVIKAVAGYEKTWTAVSFEEYGSLYYAQDVQDEQDVGRQERRSVTYVKDGVEVQDDRFAMGPVVHRQSLDHGRGAVDFDRGPCEWNVLCATKRLTSSGSTVEEYCLAIGRREMACVEAIDPLPRPPATMVGRYIPTRARKLAALKLYMKLVPYLLPTDPTITTGHLWHNDLHGENIFVDATDHGKITGIIDWQSASIAPLFDHTHPPSFLDYEGPELDGIEQPAEPDLAGLAPEARAFASALYWEMVLACAHRNLVHYRNARLERAYVFSSTLAYTLLITARNLLLDGEAIYQQRVVEDLAADWDSLPAVQASGLPRLPYPFTFSADEMQDIRSASRAMGEGILCMNEIKAEMGRLFPLHGGVSHEEYAEVTTMLAAYEERVLGGFARNQEERGAVRQWWPWRDGVLNV